jgi:hypothetical protein
MHWAITGKTAAEIIHSRADSAKPNMGLTSWRGARVRKDDVAIAKNYLDVNELAALNNLVEQYLVFAEGQAMRRVPSRMQLRRTTVSGVGVMGATVAAATTAQLGLSSALSAARSLGARSIPAAIAHWAPCLALPVAACWAARLTVADRAAAELGLLNWGR